MPSSHGAIEACCHHGIFPSKQLAIEATFHPIQAIKDLVTSMECLNKLFANFHADSHQ
jgi:hypothetical protein